MDCTEGNWCTNKSDKSFWIVVSDKREKSWGQVPLFHKGAWLLLVWYVLQPQKVRRFLSIMHQEDSYL